MLKKLLACAMTTALLAIPLPSLADNDHNQARSALQAGEIQPLTSILAQVAKTHPGQVLKIELDREHGRWVYELKLLQPDGSLLKLELDARSGETLTSKSKRH